ncbi:iron chaperone [Phyllobacterium sp. TAF24]|uniref:iron chaperone n=1 Tax=Phyllobacterium sp. TAF24 TaxID=3233068 RepID=UPI003F948A4D
MTGEKTRFSTVEEYLQSLPDKARAVLEKLRETIHETAPEAEELISYQIPAFRFHGMLIYYSAYTQHVSLSFPAFKVFEVFKEEFTPYELSKSTVRFRLDEPLPLDLVREIVKFRMKENLEMEAAKSKGKKS